MLELPKDVRSTIVPSANQSSLNISGYSVKDDMMGGFDGLEFPAQIAPNKTGHLTARSENFLFSGEADILRLCPCHKFSNKRVEAKFYMIKWNV